MTPRAGWEQWQREGRPTAGSRKPLVDYLVSNALWHFESALISEAKGQNPSPGCVEQMQSTVADLAQLLREAA
jgi:hypothetical protein